MKLELKPLLKKLQPFLNFLKKDSVAIFLVIVAIVFGFLIWRIGSLAGAEPSQDALDESLLKVVRPKIDQDSIAKIKALQAQNVDIQSYFVDRNNPFQE
ncbi:MAG: hypothetical protein JWO47_341 [Candidatus Saccharibacteria bacterium]|nr:hypothetical protein [Candidatus Saccharibacteria bacterium]